MTCVFCKIAAGEIPSHKVGENGGAFAFLDIKPLARGHVLVVPKAHAARVADLSPDAAADVMRLARDVTARLPKVGAEGVTLAINDGEAAGQEVPHVHLHLVPRRADDGAGGLHGLFGGGADAAAEGLKAVADALRA